MFYKTIYAHISVDMDFNKGFPAEINPTTLNYVWVQNVSFQCKSCYEVRHVIKNCPKRLHNSKDRQKKEGQKELKTITIQYTKRNNIQIRKNQKIKRKYISPKKMHQQQKKPSKKKYMPVRILQIHRKWKRNIPSWKVDLFLNP